MTPVPAELSVLHQTGQVLQGVIVHAVAEIDILWHVPHIGIPQGKRLLEHLGEGFLRIAGHVSHLGKGDGKRSVGRIVQAQFIGPRRGLDQILDPGCQGFEAHVQAQVVTVIGERGHVLPVQGETDRCPLFAVTLQDHQVRESPFTDIQAWTAMIRSGVTSGSSSNCSLPFPTTSWKCPSTYFMLCSGVTHGPPD